MSPNAYVNANAISRTTGQILGILLLIYMHFQANTNQHPLQDALLISNKL